MINQEKRRTPTLKLLLFLALATLGTFACKTEAVTPPTPADPLQVCCGGETTSSQESRPVSGIISENFGTIEQGEVFEKEFLLRNTTDEVVQLNDEIETNYPCCLEASISQKRLEPGQDATVTVSFDSTLRPGPIDLFVNLPWDKAGVESKLHLGGIVEEDVAVEPTGLKFQEQGESIEFRVWGSGLNDSYSVAGFRNNLEGVEIKEVSRGQNEIVYQATWNGPKDATQIQSFEILTDHKMVKSFPIMVAPPAAKI